MPYFGETSRRLQAKSALTGSNRGIQQKLALGAANAQPTLPDRAIQQQAPNGQGGANGPCYLLGLPWETRQLILNYALSDLHPSVPAQGDCGGWVPPPILRACRTLRIDAMPMYLETDFVFDICYLDIEEDYYNMVKWCERIGQGHQLYEDFKQNATISSFVELEYSDDDYPDEDVPMRCANLRKRLRLAYEEKVPGVLLDEDRFSGGGSGARSHLAGRIWRKKALAKIFRRMYELKAPPLWNAEDPVFCWREVVHKLEPGIDKSPVFRFY